jgi:hypothetical protein
VQVVGAKSLLIPKVREKIRAEQEGKKIKGDEST